MSTSTRWTAGLLLGAALLSFGCDFQHTSSVANPFAPSLTTGDGRTTALGGTWSSGTAGLPVAPNACGDFQWQITSLSVSGVSGTFSATCAGGVRVTGDGTGTLAGSSLEWGVKGTASGPAGLPCPFDLKGTAVPETVDTVRVNYAGSVCGVGVSGSEVWRRR